MATVRRWLWCTHTPHIENQQSNISGSFIFATFFIISLSMVVARAATNARSICAMRVCAQHSYRRPASIRAYWIWVNGTTLAAGAIHSVLIHSVAKTICSEWFEIGECVWRGGQETAIESQLWIVSFISFVFRRLGSVWKIYGKL